MNNLQRYCVEQSSHAEESTLGKDKAEQMKTPTHNEAVFFFFFFYFHTNFLWWGELKMT